MNDRMFEKLMAVTNTNNIVAVYSDLDNTDKFAVGFIAAIDETYCILKHISARGFYDGFILIKTANIYQIGYSCIYEKKIEKLYYLQNTRHSSDVLFKDNLLLSLLEYAKNMKCVISVEINYSGLYDSKGLIVDFDKDCLTLNEFMDNGEPDGTTIIDITEITKIACDTDDEQDLKKLIEYQET